MAEESGIKPDSKFVSQIRNNTKSDFIEITEDKLENILLKHLNNLSKARSWITPVSLFFTILIALLTADFKDFIGIEKSVWKAIFALSLIGTLIWSIISVIQSIRYSQKVTLECIVKNIKNSKE